MGRPSRISLGGFIYHVLNRGNGRLPIFHKDLDYEALLGVLGETPEHVPGIRLLAYCLMPNLGISCFGPARTANCPTSCTG
jgi:putative transposase